MTCAYYRCCLAHRTSGLFFFFSLSSARGERRTPVFHAILAALRKKTTTTNKQTNNEGEPVGRHFGRSSRRLINKKYINFSQYSKIGRQKLNGESLKIGKIRDFGKEEQHHSRDIQLRAPATMLFCGSQHVSQYCMQILRKLLYVGFTQRKTTTKLFCALWYGLDINQPLLTYPYQLHFVTSLTSFSVTFSWYYSFVAGSVNWGHYSSGHHWSRRANSHSATDYRQSI